MADDDAAALKYVFHPNELAAYRLAGEIVGAFSLRARIQRVSLVGGIEPASARDKDVLVMLAGEAACALYLGVGPSPMSWSALKERVSKGFTELSPGRSVSLELEAQMLSRERVEVYTRVAWWRATRLCFLKHSQIGWLALRLLERGIVDGDTVLWVLRRRRTQKGGENEER